MPISKGGRPEIQHPSVAALLAAHPGERDAEKLMRRLAREKVAYAKRFGWSGPPFCPKKFTSLFKIHCKEVDHDIGGDGRILLRKDGKPQIEYRNNCLPERQRFTIFHEFAHMLFPDYCEFLPQYYNAQDIESAENKQFEYLCDVGATEMLFPFDNFRADLKTHSQLGFETVDNLRVRYQASIDATTHRMIELADHVSCSAAFLTDQKGKYDGAGPLWVKYSKKTSRFYGLIWPGTCPPSDSVALRCYKSGQAILKPVREVWRVKGKAKTFLVQAAKLPDVPANPEYPKVAVIFFPSA